MTSLTLRIQLGRRDDVEAFAFRWGTASYLRHFPGRPTLEGRLAWTGPVQRDLATLALHPGHPEATARLGDALRAFLTQVGWAEDEARIQRALSASPPLPVNVVLRLEAAELFALPWELATLGDGSALGKLSGVNLRFQWPGTVPAAERPAPRPEGGRLLFAWSAAGGAVPASEHIDAIATAMDAAGMPFDRERDVLPDATHDALAAGLWA